MHDYSDSGFDRKQEDFLPFRTYSLIGWYVIIQRNIEPVILCISYF